MGDNFHNRLCSFVSNCIYDLQEWHSKGGRCNDNGDSTVSLVQGSLFSNDSDAKATRPPKVEDAKPIPQEPKKTKPIMIPPMKKLTYADYLEIHCGNKLAANYWYMRNEGRPLA